MVGAIRAEPWNRRRGPSVDAPLTVPGLSSQSNCVRPIDAMPDAIGSKAMTVWSTGGWLAEPAGFAAMSDTENPCAGHRHRAEMVGHAVWTHFRSGLSWRDAEERLAARGAIVTGEPGSHEAPGGDARRRYPARGGV